MNYVNLPSMKSNQSDVGAWSNCFENDRFL